jgi:hypothetical protein
MAIDSLSGLIQWRPTVSQVGSHTFTVVASDTLGLRDSTSQEPRELTFVDEATFWSTF